MCTASLIATGQRSWRFAFNRDELRDRAPAEAPSLCTVDGVACAWPVDGAAGGTWIAASARGLVLALLNRNADDAERWRRSAGLRSRGAIIPELIASPGAGAALDALAERPLDRFAPFALIVIDDGTVATATWDGSALSLAPVEAGGPRMWASSGYGDERVRAPRAAAFAAVAADPDPARQDAFHAGREGADHVAWVAMRRDDARSVSRTVIAVDPTALHLRYAPLDEDGHEGPAAELRLARGA